MSKFSSKTTSNHAFEKVLIVSYINQLFGPSSTKFLERDINEEIA